ncbi:MAG: alpha/beta fold hydrolase [Porticoccus sp.]|jgi:triacylglycerol lipase|uniref:alpha/beta fold hydrolase n=1 Tax=Porticoccus sp. TaxID=2024853 RepID=UPI003297E275
MNPVFAFLLAIFALVIAWVILNRVFPRQAAKAGIGLERWRSCLDSKIATIPGATMPYLEGGCGEPLVLIHGFGGDKDNFTRIARFLTPHYHLIIPDLPGFGDASRDPDASYQVTDQAKSLCEFLNVLGLKRVHLGGNSMGGFIVCQFAAEQPERVASLWLLNAAGTEPAYESDLLKHYLATGELPMLLRSAGDFKKLMQMTTHKPPFLPYAIRSTLARRSVADFDLHSEIIRQVTASPMLETQFKTIDTPALIVWGNEDQILHPAGAAALQSLLPNSEVRMMSDIGHLPMLEAPRRTARDYIRYRNRF